MWLFWLAVFVIVGLAIYFTVRALRRSEPPRESPREILDRRFARGEIDREEYERAIKDLRQF
jgi:putative membrane protein